jgi:small-conductance mechanosensitive channel
MIAAHFNGESWMDVVQALVVLVAGAFCLKIGLRALDALAQNRRFEPFTFRPVRTLLKWLGIIVLVAMLLGRFGFDLLTPLSTVLALVAVGFVAVWSVISNFLCTFLLIIFRPFHIGEYIELLGGDGARGRVVELTNIHTVLEDDDGAIYCIPNNLFFQKSIRKLRRGPATSPAKAA